MIGIVSQPHAKLHRLGSDSDHVHDDLVPDATNTYDLGSAAFRWRAIYTDFISAVQDIDWGGNLVRGPVAYYQIQQVDYFEFNDAEGAVWWNFFGVNGIQAYLGTQPDMPRNVQVVNGDLVNPHTFTIYGINSIGATATDIIFVAAGATFVGNVPFAHINQVRDDDIGGNAHQIQASRKFGLSNSFIVGSDIYKVTKNQIDNVVTNYGRNPGFNTLEEIGVPIAANDRIWVWCKI